VGIETCTLWAFIIEMEPGSPARVRLILRSCPWAPPLHLSLWIKNTLGFHLNNTSMGRQSFSDKVKMATG
jgi:hypothetical protein